MVEGRGLEERAAERLGCRGREKGKRRGRRKGRGCHVTWHEGELSSSPSSSGTDAFLLDFLVTNFFLPFACGTATMESGDVGVGGI